MLQCCKQFFSWAEKFELAPLARKRVILSQLLEKVELGRGYQVTLHLKLTIRQFLELMQKKEKITQTKMENGSIASPC